MQINVLDVATVHGPATGSASRPALAPRPHAAPRSLRSLTS